MTWRVVVADRVAKSGLDLLSNTPDIEVVDVAGKPAELDRAIAAADALIVRSETRVTAALMARAPHLRVVARAGTGVDTIDVPAATRRGIAVMNTPGANTVSAGEHAMGLLLALVRRISDAAAAMRRTSANSRPMACSPALVRRIAAAGSGIASASKAPSCVARRWVSWGWGASAVTSRSWRERSGCRSLATIRICCPSAPA